MINYGPVLSELPRFLGAPIPSLLDLIRDALGGQSITIMVRSTPVHFRLASVEDKLKTSVVNNRRCSSSDCIFWIVTRVLPSVDSSNPKLLFVHKINVNCTYESTRETKALEMYWTEEN